MTIQFGYCLPIFSWPGGGLFRTPSYQRLDVQKTMALAVEADTLGYDSIWIADHLMLGQDMAIMEGWTTTAAIAGATKQAKLGIIHQATFMRYPSVAAKMIGTIDQITGGRFIYFTDTGTQPREHHAYGLTYPDTQEERMPYLIEGLELILRLWAAPPDQPITVDGLHYQVRDAVCMPKPVQQPHPPIWFGEAHPLILQACARYGDGWNSTPVGSVELKRRLDALDAACRAEGRNPAEVERSFETQILVAPDHAALRESLRKMLALTPPGGSTPDDAAFKAFVDGTSDALPAYLTDAWLVGTPDEVKQQIQQRIDMGISHFMLWFMDAPDDAGMKLFIEQVAPAFRTS